MGRLSTFAGAFLLSLLTLSFLVRTPSALGRVTCGDRICEGDEKCGTCRLDCGACSAVKECGDGLCALNGGESFEQCPKDCPRLNKGGAAVSACGDAVCSLEEDCAECPKDCGSCSYSFQSRVRVALRRAFRFAQRFLQEQGAFLAQNVRLFLRDALGSFEEQRRLLGERALERSEASQQLVQFLAQHEDVQRRLNTLDTQIIRTMSDPKKASVFTAIPAIVVRAELRRVARADHEELVRLTQAVLSQAQEPGLLQDLPHADAVRKAAQEGDLATIAAFLPAPTKEDVAGIVRELQTLRGFFVEEEGSAHRSSPGAFLPARALAQEIAGKEPVDAKDAFRESVELTQKLRAIAEDPAQGLPPLEERLAYLQKRGDVLAGIINLPTQKVKDQLQNVQDGLPAQSTHSLLNLVGLFRYLRNTPNFAAAEISLASSVERMQSGIARLRSSLFGQRMVPQAEAVSLLEQEWGKSTLATFQEGGDLTARKEILQQFVGRERANLDPLLQRLSPDEREKFETQFAETQSKIASAENPTAVRNAMEEWERQMTQLQKEARMQRTIFLRFIYVLQDFFGLT